MTGCHLGLALASVWIGVGADVPMIANRLAELHSDDPNIRIEAARSLGELGPSAHSAVPALTLVLCDPSKRVVFAAHDALVRIGPCDELLQELHHPVESIRFGVLRAVESMRSASIASDAILPSLTHPSDRVRWMAVKAAIRHCDGQTDVKAALHAARSDASPEVREVAERWANAHQE